jgi:nitronate monooxygenase
MPDGKKRLLVLSTKLRPLVIGDKIAPLPIIQGGMGVGISLSGLASAVANAGGIGVIAAAGIGMYERDFYSNYLKANARALRREIRKAKLLTGGILGLNIMVAFSNYGDLVRVAIEEEIDVIFSGAGLPMTMPQYLDKNSKTKLVPIISSGRAAGLICKRWLSRYDYLPDAVVVEGPMAGGHLGFSQAQIFDPAFALEKLVPEVVEDVHGFSAQYGKPIPIIAAGGIYTGADIRAIMELGANAVQMGTRFVATHECDADILFKQAYIDAKPEDIVIINSPVGMPGRAIRNRYLDDVGEGIKKPYRCPYHCILTCNYKSSPYCIAHALISAKRGRFRNGFAFAGANVHRVSEIVSVNELISTLVAEYEQSAKEAIDVPPRTRPS